MQLFELAMSFAHAMELFMFCFYLLFYDKIIIGKFLFYYNLNITL